MDNAFSLDSVMEPPAKTPQTKDAVAAKGAPPTFSLDSVMAPSTRLKSPAPTKMENAKETGKFLINENEIVKGGHDWALRFWHSIAEPSKEIAHEASFGIQADSAAIAGSAGKLLLGLVSTVIGEPVSAAASTIKDTIGLTGTIKYAGEGAGHIPGVDPEEAKVISQGVNDFTQFALETYLSGPGAFAHSVEAAAPAIIGTKADFVAGERGAAADARVAAKQKAEAEAEAARAAKPRVRPVDGAYQRAAEASVEKRYEELAATNPKAAEHIAAKVEQVHPEGGAKLRETIQKVQDQGGEEHTILGHEAVTAEMEAEEAAVRARNMEGSDPSHPDYQKEESEAAEAVRRGEGAGKQGAAPARGRLPEDTFESRRIAEQFKEETGHDISMAELRQTGASVRDNQRKAGNTQIGTNPDGTPKHMDLELEGELYTKEQKEMIKQWKLARRTPEAFDGSFGVTRFTNHSAWRQASYKVQALLMGAIAAGRGLKAHEVLDEFLQHDLHPAVIGVVKKLRKYATDMDITFGTPHNPITGDIHLGEYDPNRHSIELHDHLVLDGKMSDYAANVVLHELVHAVTSRLLDGLRDNHPLKIEISALLEEARARAKTMSKDGKVDHTKHYGLLNEHEFVTEIFTNPAFQKFLTASESVKSANWKSPKVLLNKFAEVVGKLLGVTKPEELDLLSAAMSNAERLMQMQKAGMEANAKAAARGARSEPVMQKMSAGLSEASSDLTRAASVGKEDPAYKVAAGKSAEYYNQIRQTFAVHTMGSGAAAADAYLAEGMARVAQREAQSSVAISKANEKFWQLKENKAQVWNWLDHFEKGAKFKDDKWAAIARNYIDRGLATFQHDVKHGIEYEPIDNYMMHAFHPKDGMTVDEFFKNKYGAKWGDPGFIKDRSYEAYSEAMKAGWKPKFSTPEQMMVAREHASNIAGMKVEFLEDLAKSGFAIPMHVVKDGKKVKLDAPPGFARSYRSPNGDWYHVEDNSYRVMRNAFETTSLWNVNNIGGDAFRALMAAKNQLVPIRLMGLFHVSHIGLALDNATAFGRLAKELVAPAATRSNKAILSEMVQTFTPMVNSFFLNPKMGMGLMKAYNGSLNRPLSETEALTMKYFNEAGFIPTMSKEWQAQGIQKFQEALANKSLSAVPRAFPALLQAMQKPIFEVWIPSLKTATMAKEIATHLRANPELLNDPLARRIDLRRIQRHVDARYGEMNYSTLFWTKWMKDLLVANTLSIGWQKGVIDQFAGAPVEVANALIGATRGKNPTEALRRGDLDRATYAMGYGLLTSTINGLITYGNTGSMPTGLDYLLPRTGNKNPDGTDSRLSTPFFTREFVGVYKHMENRGVLRGMGDLATSKSSGIIGQVAQGFRGQSDLGTEFRDPQGTFMQKTGQTLNFLLHENLPISATQKADSTNQRLSNIVGFTPAPKYMTDSPATALTKTLYQDYYAKKATPFEKAEQSKDAAKYRDAVGKGDSEKADEILQTMQKTYKLTGRQVQSLARTTARGGSGLETMFKALDWQQQKQVLAKASAEEKERLLPLAKVQVRAPEEFEEQ